jgi:hypothetical protein
MGFAPLYPSYELHVALPEGLNVLFRHELTALGLRESFANGRTGLFVEVVRTAWPLFGEGEHDGSKRILIFVGKRARLGDGSIENLYHANASITSDA